MYSSNNRESVISPNRNISHTTCPVFLSYISCLPYHVTFIRYHVTHIYPVSRGMFVNSHGWEVKAGVHLPWWRFPVKTALERAPQSMGHDWGCDLFLEFVDGISYLIRICIFASGFYVEAPAFDSCLVSDVLYKMGSASFVEKQNSLNIFDIKVCE